MARDAPLVHDLKLHATVEPAACVPTAAIFPASDLCPHLNDIRRVLFELFRDVSLETEIAIFSFGDFLSVDPHVAEEHDPAKIE